MGTSMQEERGRSRRGTGRSSGRDGLCLSVLIRRLKKSKLGRVAQMPFIGLTSMASRGHGHSSYLSWLPSPLSWEFRTRPQGRSVSGRDGRQSQDKSTVLGLKGAQEDVENTGLPGHPGAGPAEAFPTRALGLARNEGSGGKASLEASYCALRAISISRMLSSASFTLRSR